MKEIRAPICSSRVKGSRSSIAQAKQEREGAMNVTTVASASGMYRRESKVEMLALFFSQALKILTVHPKHAKETTDTS